MAGTLTISTLSDGTNSTSSTNCIQGSAKAWVNFNGTTSPGTIRASYNVSSVTKNSTGDYTVNFINAMIDANYAVSLASNANITQQNPSFAQTSSAMRFVTSTTSVFQDTTYTHVSVFR